MKGPVAAAVCAVLSLGIGAPTYVLVRESQDPPTTSAPAVVAQGATTLPSGPQSIPSGGSAPASTSPSPLPVPTTTAARTAAPSDGGPDTGEEVAQEWVVTYVVDGDTLDVARSGVEERVRLIGIDTPERGECGFEEAARALTFLALGREVRLVTSARTSRDRYDRVLAYVDLDDGTDTGLTLLQDGFAAARYDSRDGYGAHPREDPYVAADVATGPVPPARRPCRSPRRRAGMARLEPSPAAGRDGCPVKATGVRRSPRKPGRYRSDRTGSPARAPGTSIPDRSGTARRRPWPSR